MPRRKVTSEELRPVLGEVLPAIPRLRPRRRVGEAVRGLIEAATGTPVPSVEEDPDWQPPAVTISVPLMARLTLEGLAVIRDAAVEAGNVRAAMYLVDRGLGAVGQSFEEKAKQYTLEQARAELVRELEALGLTPEQIDGYVARALAPAVTGEGE